MHNRLAHRLDRAGLTPDARASVLQANARALLHRVGVLGDDEHFDALHPSRAILILLDDCEVADAAVLAATAQVESFDERLRVSGDAGLARGVPLPDRGERLLEELVIASAEIRLIALAERLDHARHLHLRPRSSWTPFHRTIAQVYTPIARRTHPRLARRFEWWECMFARRFLELANGR